MTGQGAERQRGQFMMTKQVKSVLDAAEPAFKNQLFATLEDLALTGESSSEVGSQVFEGRKYRVAEVAGKQLVFRSLANDEKIDPEGDRNRDVFLLFDIQ